MNTLLVTGASSDVGIKLIDYMVQRYDFVWAHYHQMNDKLMEIHHSFPEKIRFVQADFFKRDDTKKMIEEIAHAHLIPNHIVHLPAEKYMLSNFHNTEWEVYERNTFISIRSIIMILQRFIPEVIKRASEGRIVFMLSECTCNLPPAYTAHYTMTKYALLGLMKALAAEYEKKGIMVNGISPGMMETKFLDQIPRLVIEKSARENSSGKNIEVKELMDVFELLLFGNCMISGQNIAIKSL